MGGSAWGSHLGLLTLRWGARWIRAHSAGVSRVTCSPHQLPVPPEADLALQTQRHQRVSDEGQTGGELTPVTPRISHNPAPKHAPIRPGLAQRKFSSHLHPWAGPGIAMATAEPGHAPRWSSVADHAHRLGLVVAPPLRRLRKAVIGPFLGVTTPHRALLALQA